MRNYFKMESLRASPLRRNKSFIIASIAGLLILCFQMKANCQEQFGPQAKFVTKFPFKMLTGGIILVTATIDDKKDSLNFVLDTGGGGISLDSATAAFFQLKVTPTERTIRGIGGIKQIPFAYNHTLKLPGVTIDNLDFHINDYELLSSVYGVPIDGIMGYSILRRFIIYIDYDAMEISFYSPGSYKYQRGGFFLHPTFSTLPMQNAVVRDDKRVEGKFYFDTGAGLCMLFSEDFVEDSAFLFKKKKMYKTQGEGLGGKAPMNITTIKEVKIGPYKFRRIPAYIFKDEYNVTSYPMLGGLIGNDILRRFNTVLNYPEQVFYLKPNTHFNDPFDYAYTGLGIYMVDNEITVLDVLEHSPGKAAGFEPGDIIVAMNNNFNKDIQAYKTVLQAAGTKVKVIVQRKKEIKMLTLHVKDIRK
jgi:hypothetical protein